VPQRQYYPNLFWEKGEKLDECLKFILSDILSLLATVADGKPCLAQDQTGLFIIHAK